MDRASNVSASIDMSIRDWDCRSVQRTGKIRRDRGCCRYGRRGCGGGLRAEDWVVFVRTRVGGAWMGDCTFGELVRWTNRVLLGLT